MDVAGNEAEDSPDPEGSRAQIPETEPIRTSAQFYARYKEWVDEQNRRYDELGLWNDELRTW